MAKCKIKQISQEYCIARRRDIDVLCESLRKDIDILGQKIDLEPDVATLYDEKCKQLKCIIDEKLRGSCIRARFLYINEIDTSSKYLFNLEKEKGCSKRITHLKLNDTSITEDESVIRTMTVL